MTPTREQIIEGRDEALLHLRIPPFVFDSVEYPERQAGALRRAMVDDVDTSAVLTVVEAMALTTTAGVAAHWWGVRWRSSFAPSSRGGPPPSPTSPFKPEEAA